MKLEDLLNTTEGMTCLRNGSKQDDGVDVDTVTGVDWFTFNGVVASNIYVSGNSFVGFGSNAEHLKVNRRDAAMWYLYRQEGTIGQTKFLKIRWEGYAVYNSTSASYAQKWELFLFDDGGLYVNFVNVPSVSGYIGTNALVCGSKTYSFAVSLGTPVAYSFIPKEDGTFEVSTELYPVSAPYVPSGSVEFITTAIKKITAVNFNRILWEADIPESTTLKVFSKLSSGEYAECTNNGQIQGISSGQDLSSETLYIKVEMTTTNTEVSPALRSLKIVLSNQADAEKILLTFPAGVLESFQRAAGNITVAYDGTGSLVGQGGPVLAFEETFTPAGLDPKNNPNEAEHIEISSIVVNAVLKKIDYINTKCDEHISISSITAVGALTNIHDI